jgi:hypothetical protein
MNSWMAYQGKRDDSWTPPYVTAFSQGVGGGPSRTRRQVVWWRGFVQGMPSVQSSSRREGRGRIYDEELMKLSHIGDAAGGRIESYVVSPPWRA